MDGAGELAHGLELSSLFRSFPGVIGGLITSCGATSVMEIGAGRDPLFTAAQVEAAGVARYVLNDIDPAELALAPPEFPQACFDICGSVPFDAPTDLDLVFSRSVIEHLTDTATAYRNIHAMLRPGGVMFHFYPTLYALPFVVNRVLPEAAADRVLRVVRPRDRDQSPKFPASYRMCRSTMRVESAVRGLGFSDVSIKPFYTHAYYRRIPMIHQVHLRAAGLYERLDWRALSSYAVLVARKG